MAEPVTQTKVNSIEIRMLKNLKILEELSFEGSELTAIMGPNGCGKTTILHALACCYKPLRDVTRPNWKFCIFFTPTTDTRWSNSYFTLNHSYRVGQQLFENIHVAYSKLHDRWTPRYDRRPERHVIYIGIDSSVPIIETEKKQSLIRYQTTPLNGDIHDIVKDKAGYIMNRNYSLYNLHRSARSEFIGVEHEGIKYPALSMGAGEQRIFKILEEVFSAPPYSLILIDEIDLLLHTDALKKMIDVLKERAANKHLQIIFTTHSLTIASLNDKVNIRHIYNTAQKTLILKETKPDAIFRLTGETHRIIEIFVEDDLAKTIIQVICESLRLSKYVTIKEYGAAINCFTLAAGLILSNENIKNCLFVLDGDEYKTQQAKQARIDKVLTGTTQDIPTMKAQVLEHVHQFILPDGYHPERYINQSIIQLTLEEPNEIQQIANEIVNVDENHKYINDIVERIGIDRLVCLRRIVDLFSKSQNWDGYVGTIRDWLISKRNLVE